MDRSSGAEASHPSRPSSRASTERSGRRAKRRNPSYESLTRGTPELSPSEQGGTLRLLPHHDSSDKMELGGGVGPVNWRACLMAEPLLVATLAGVVCGITLGLLLKLAQPSAQVISLIGFPGELMLRLLKMLVLPLVAVSMVSGVCALQAGGQGVGRLAKLTFAYYAGSTLVAIGLGILLVQVIRPGRNAPFDSLGEAASGGCSAAHARVVQAHASAPPAAAVSTLDALLNVGREVVPDNVVAAAVNMNILGVITFSLMLGVALASMGTAAEGVVQLVSVLNAAILRMVTWALWVSPLGVGSLIAASILRACDLIGTLSALGLWAATVVLGLALFAFLILPGALYLVTRMSPLRVTAAFAQSLLMAFGTSSSAASLPLAMKAAREVGCEEGTASFFLPLGTTINMNGTALYEATTAIFIAQAHDVALGPAELLVVAFTASLAAVGAPAIPSAGLVTMLIVLQAVNLGQYASDLAVILAVDWLLDRVRTTVNLLSDAYGCVMVDTLLQPSKWREAAAAGGGGRDDIPLVTIIDGGSSSGVLAADGEAQEQGQQQAGFSGLLGGRRPGYVQLQDARGRG